MKLEEITEVDINQAAIARAEKAGWRVELDDCKVQKVLPPPQVKDEIGLGTSTFKSPVTKWFVHITPKAPPNEFTAHLIVTVEFSWSILDAEHFEGLDHPH